MVMIGAPFWRFEGRPFVSGREAGRWSVARAAAVVARGDDERQRQHEERGESTPSGERSKTGTHETPPETIHLEIRRKPASRFSEPPLALGGRDDRLTSAHSSAT